MTSNNQFQLDRRAVRDSFDRAAAGYDAVAVLQREVQSRLLERLELINFTPAAILDAGAGTGNGVRALAELYPDADITALDVAPRMLAAISGDKARVCGDIEAPPFGDACFDLVWSNLAMQWLGDPDRGFGELRRVLNEHGLLLFSTFGPDTLRELRSAWSEVDDFNHVNHFIDMHDLGDALVRAGFAEPVMDVEQLTLTYEDIDGLLRDLKGLGAHNVTAGRPRGLTGRARLNKLKDAYERWRIDGRLPATWEVVYGIAWAPMAFERVALSHQGEIPPGELRELLRRKRHGA
ncbi:MAG TPA: malonyl-ACP O-methyltransferase BioC [Gammaproteobacteria bacterium]|nr:malonyl-ACP O-methyltransferase BioC [Gammaproteobacteria bacterium]